MSSKIKLGVSLYSYQDEFFRHKMTLEECIELSSRILVMKDGEISADMDCRTRKPTQLEIVQHMM